MAETKKKLPFIEGFISQILSKNFTSISGERLQVKVVPLSFEDFQSEAESIKTGRIIYVYTETDSAVMSMLLPGTAQKILKKFYSSGRDEPADEDLTKFLNRLLGNIPYLCSIKEKGAETNVLTLQKPYSSDLKDQLLWDASECNVFRCSVLGSVFYMTFNIEIQKAVESSLKADPDFKKFLVDRVRSRQVSGEGFSELKESDVKIRVKNPLEFIIGNSFLPRESYLGGKDVSVVFNGIIAAENPASRISGGMIWYQFMITSGGKEYPVYYSVEAKSKDRKILQFYNGLFTEMVKKTAVFLRSQIGFDRVSGKIIQRPPLDDIEDSVILAGGINWENRRINTRIFVTRQFVSGYLSSLLEAGEAEELQNSKMSVLLSLLSVNSAVFGKNISSFYRMTGPEASKGEVQPLSVSKIMAILDTNNAGRLVQNYFLAGGSSLDEFQSLFLYRYQAEGDEKPKLGRDALFNKEEYKRYIPGARHSDWDRCRGTSASKAECGALNEKALKGIYGAIQEDKLLMPYKVFSILYNEFQKPMDERYKGEIKTLIEVTQWQELIALIPKKTGQQAVSAIPTATLGAALVAGQPTAVDLANLMSKTKRKELEEEVRLNIKKYEKGSLSAEKVFLALKELLDVLNELASPDEEMI